MNYVNILAERKVSPKSVCTVAGACLVNLRKIKDLWAEHSEQRAGQRGYRVRLREAIVTTSVQDTTGGMSGFCVLAAV